MKHIYTVKLETPGYAFEFATSRRLADLEGWKYAVVCQLLQHLRLASDAGTQEVIVAVERWLHTGECPMEMGRNESDNLIVTIKQLPFAE